MEKHNGENMQEAEKEANKVETDNNLAAEPWDTHCFTKDFANMIMLFNSLTRGLELSQPFRMVIDYDPEQLRTSVKTYLPKELHESRIRKALEMPKD